MKLSRRAMLTTGLGISQLALLSKFNLMRSAKAAPPADGPTKFLMLYLTGGIRQHYIFNPMTDAEIVKSIPPHWDWRGGPAGFRPMQLQNLATGDGTFPALRMPKYWDDSNPANTGSGFSPFGYGWKHFDLASQVSIIHGVDQGTNAHASGQIATMCGLAGATYRAPAVHSVIANYLHSRFADTRPLPCVSIKSAAMPNAYNLPSASAPILVPAIKALQPTLSADPAVNPWWKGLDTRTPQPALGFDGAAIGGNLELTDLEGNVLDTVRSFKGKSSVGTDHVLEQLYTGYAGVSKVLARNVADVLGKTKGAEHLTSLPYTANIGDGFGFHFGANFAADMTAPLDMVVRLLKSDLATSIHCHLDELYYDTHNGSFGHAFGGAVLRAEMDVVARLLGEMKLTPAPGKPGKTLLDDTLVVVVSEFGRSWPSGPNQDSIEGWNLPDDHHPYTSVLFAGGGIAGNRQIGGFTLPNAIGKEVDVIEETGAPGKRVPRAADITTTICKVMGLGSTDFFIPGGYGEVVGMRRV